MDTLSIFSALFSGIVAVSMPFALKAMFDIRGELSSISGAGQEQSKRLEDIARRVDRHDARWDALQIELKVDRQEFRNAITGQMLELQSHLSEMDRTLAALGATFSSHKESIEREHQP